jgi:hypothetical protein
MAPDLTLSKQETHHLPTDEIPAFPVHRALSRLEKLEPFWF